MNITRQWLLQAFNQKNIILILLILMFAISLLLLSTGLLHSAYSNVSGGLFSDNHDFIEEATGRSESVLKFFSDLYVALLVLQSVQFSISFFLEASVTLGNTLAQATDLASLGKNAAFASLTSLKILDGFMQLLNWLAPWLIIIAEAAVIMIYAIKKFIKRSHSHFKMALMKLSESLIISVLTLMIGIPMAVKFVAFVDQEIHAEILEKSYNALKDSHGHVITSPLMDKKTEIDTGDVIKEFKTVRLKLADNSSSLFTNISQYIALTLVQLLLLPLLCTGILYYWIRCLIKNNRLIMDLAEGKSSAT